MSENRDAIAAGIEVQLDTFLDGLMDSATDAGIDHQEVADQLRDDYSEDLGQWFNDRRAERGLV